MNAEDMKVTRIGGRTKAPLRRTDGGTVTAGAGAASQPAAATSTGAQPDSGTENPFPFVEPEQRRAMIAEAAYYLAERRGFEPGRELEDWYSAEGEIDGRLTRGASTELCGTPAES